MNKHHYNNKLIVFLQLGCFVPAFILGQMAPFIEEHPQETVFKITDSLYITACILLGFKLAREGWEIPAAGYTLLTIAWGVFFQSLDLTNVVGPKLFDSAFFFITPGYLLVAFYKEFPWWIRSLTLLCPLPFLIVLIGIRTATSPENFNLEWLGYGFGYVHLIGTIWGIFFFIQHRKETRANTLSEKT